MNYLAKLTIISTILAFSNQSYSLEFDSEFDEIVFITPTKSSVSIGDSPNFITRLTSEDLNDLGIDSIPDALRLVPGMLVSDLHGSNTQVGYHGLAASIPRRMDVLFNSSSIYRPGYAGTHWRRLPFWIQDIESIEILRGSATSDFGSNALTGAVNLIQKSIALEDTTFGSVRVGSSDTKRVRGGVHFGNSTDHIYARAFYEESSGYDFTKRSPIHTDDFDGTGFLLSGEHSVSTNLLFDWNISYSNYSFKPGNLVADADFLNQADQFSTQGDILPADETNLHFIAKLSGASQGKNWNTFVKRSVFERKQQTEECIVAAT